MTYNKYLFGQGIEKDVWWITEFHYDKNGDIRIVAQKGARVEQFKFTPQALEDAGVLDINNLNNILKLKP
jgi:hypothetical protein